MVGNGWFVVGFSVAGIMVLCVLGDMVRHFLRVRRYHVLMRKPPGSREEYDETS